MPLRSVGAGLYLVSYLRNWFFPQIAKVAFALAMEGLITDTLRASLDLTGRVQADFEGIRLAPDAPGASCLLQQGQHALLRLVGLGQHGGGGLGDDLRLGQVGRLFGVVGVQDAAA